MLLIKLQSCSDNDKDILLLQILPVTISSTDGIFNLNHTIILDLSFFNSIQLLQEAEYN